MRDADKLFAVGRQLIITGLNTKEGVKKSFMAQEYDVTNEQFALLVALWSEDGQSQIDLCEKTCKNKPNVTRILDTMEKNGFIKRTLDTRDRRKFLIFLTEKGKSMQEPLMKIAFEYAEKITSGFSEEEIEMLSELLGKLNANL